METRDLARQVMQRADVLGTLSDDPSCLTRTYLSAGMGRANSQVADWMRQAGMAVRYDAIGTLIGRVSPEKPHAKTFILGSHLDSVRDAGKYDGPLGVLVAIACVELLRSRLAEFPYNLEVYAFADEEGVRYQTNYLASGAVSGATTDADLKRVDANGISLSDSLRSQGYDPNRLSDARRRPAELAGYAEVHIEQGPVLEAQNLACGVVTAITGQTRVAVEFGGQAGHAGTTPMSLRRDALCAAAEFVLAAEEEARKIKDAVATVGMIEARPGASNVIPGKVRLSLDARHWQDEQRRSLGQVIQRRAESLASHRKISLSWNVGAESKAAPCDPSFVEKMARAIGNRQSSAPQLVSGAGHDAAAMAAITPVVMLFVRCLNGISHNPAESVREDDVATAIAIMQDFLESVLAG